MIQGSPLVVAMNPKQPGESKGKERVVQPAIHPSPYSPSSPLPANSLNLILLLLSENQHNDPTAGRHETAHR